jgi:hypothetical protein
MEIARPFLPADPWSDSSDTTSDPVAIILPEVRTAPRFVLGSASQTLEVPLYA